MQWSRESNAKISGAGWPRELTHLKTSLLTRGEPNKGESTLQIRVRIPVLGAI